jgi:hypothetical protein
MCISHPMLFICRRRPLDTGRHQHRASSVCHTMVHSARKPTTRPLPRPAAIASRHATSRAMQVTSALLVSQAAPAALFTPHSPCLSISFMQAHMQGPTLPHSEGRAGGPTAVFLEARVDDASLRCHHQGLLHTLATPSLPVKSQAVVLWPGLMTQPTYDA